jgi:hypothetical protein
MDDMKGSMQPGSTEGRDLKLFCDWNEFWKYIIIAN